MTCCAEHIQKIAHCTLLCKACACNAIEGITIFSLSFFVVEIPVEPAPCVGVFCALNIVHNFYNRINVFATNSRMKEDNLSAQFVRKVCKLPVHIVKTNLPCQELFINLRDVGTVCILYCGKNTVQNLHFCVCLKACNLCWAKTYLAREQVSESLNSVQFCTATKPFR